ncbi:MAG: AfsR/SARP family transcriptional regulator [Egibacteraceae bacterium]
MRFRVLGTLDVVDGDRICTPTAPKLRSVLALLVLNANQVVTRQSLTEELWEEQPPASALTTIQTYIYQLRKVLDVRRMSDHHQAGAQLERVLLTKPLGYCLQVQPDQLDLYRFEVLFGQGQEALRGGDTELASSVLRQALGLWRGPLLADIVAGPILHSRIAALEERRLDALEQRIEADLQLGRHRQLIGELKALAAVHPLHEWFHAQLMVALYRSGRRAEALEVYQRVRHLLGDELGLEPSGELRRLQRDVLLGDHSLDICASSKAQSRALVS